MFSNEICEVFKNTFFYRIPSVAASADGYWEKDFIKRNKSTHQMCSVKKDVLKNFANFTGEHLCCILFLIKLQAFRLATLLKRDSNTSVFLWNFQNTYLRNTYERQPLKLNDTNDRWFFLDKWFCVANICVINFLKKSW